MESKDLIVQASAVWIGGNLCTWFNDFTDQIREIDRQKDKLDQLKQEIKEAHDVSNAH